MKDKNLFAYTEFEYPTYPAYVSLNKLDGEYYLTVRSRDSSAPQTIMLPYKQLLKLKYGIEFNED